MAVAYTFLPRVSLLERLQHWLRPAERRRHERLAFPCPLRCQVDGYSLEVTGIDLNAGGIALDTLHRLRRGARIVVEPPAALQGARPLTGWVRYCREAPSGYHAGVVFDANQSVNSWVAGALGHIRTSGLLEQKRRHVRVRADLPVQVRRWCGELVDAVCCDLSQGGALLHCETPFPVHERLTLLLGPVAGLARLSLPAEALEPRGFCNDRWRVGVRFLEPQGPLDDYVRILLAETWR